MPTDTTSTPDPPEVWIVLPTFNEEANVPVLHQRLSKMAEENSAYEFRFLFVDDRSTDSTVPIIVQLARDDPRVSLVHLAHNVGSHAAASAGLCHVTGDCAVVMATDLQDPPEIIPQLLEHWSAQSHIVWAARRTYETRTLFQKITSKLYWLFMRHVVLPGTQAGGADFFLVDRLVIETFKRMPERNRSVMAMLTWLGFDQTTVQYDKGARLHGKSKWTLRRKMKAVMDAVVGYSHLPMRLMITLGVLCTLVAFIYSVMVIVNAMGGSPVEGWSSLMVILLFVSGIQMTMLGILGEYLWRTLEEARGRPLFVVERFVNLPSGRRQEEGSTPARSMHQEGTASADE